jgi:hypothetical protein
LAKLPPAADPRQLPSAALGDAEDPVHIVLSAAGPDSYRRRLVTAAFLSGQLTPMQCEALLEFLEDPVGTGAAVGSGVSQVNAVKNAVLDALLRQTALPEGLVRRVLAMADNAALDAQWRDYCVQHFVPLYGRLLSAEGVEVDRFGDGKAGEAVRSACWSHVHNPGDALTATALMSLDRLADTHLEFDSAAIGRVALAVAANPASLPAARVCGLDIASRRLDHSGAVPLARQQLEWRCLCGSFRLRYG